MYTQLLYSKETVKTDQEINNTQTIITYTRCMIYARKIKGVRCKRAALNEHEVGRLIIII